MGKHSAAAKPVLNTNRKAATAGALALAALGTGFQFHNPPKVDLVSNTATFELPEVKATPSVVVAPPVDGNDQEEYDAWVEAGMPDYIPDASHDEKNGDHGDDPTVELPVAGHDWTGVAECESSNDWDINTGNGYYGGLQFSPETWDAYGGEEFAPDAHQATQAEQIIVAERVAFDGYGDLAPQGIGAWPTCGQYLKDYAGVKPVDLNAPCSDSGVAFSEANMQPSAIKLARAICAVFGDRIDTIGGWRPSDPYPDHPSGLAIDIMVPDYFTPEGSQLGSDIAGWVMDHAKEYGANYLIHKQTYWQPDGYSYVMEDRGSDTQNHYDHVHVLVNP